MVYLSKPKYEVRHRNPELEDVVWAFTPAVWLQICAASGVFWCLGFAYGKPIRPPTASLCGSLGPDPRLRQNARGGAPRYVKHSAPCFRRGR
ncbi:hypothetical protein M885DRAFT_215135 [Pelagophyceae sp. CCMP2097]|nr:hypothetical protein M885DRAFT_215135 [Pelagophyceae sp. CCMP2097]